MAVSATAPMDPAWNRMVRLLFKPFNLGEWFVLGFCAWLANLGQGGFSFNWNQSKSAPAPGATPGPGQIQNVPAWMANQFHQHGPWIALAVIGGFVLMVLLLWIQTRGKFMFLHSLATGRAAVVQPWKDYREPANNLLGFRVIILLMCLIAGLLALAASAAIGWQAFTANQMTGSGAIALLLLISSGGIILLTYTLINLLLDDFVVPTMYLRNTRVMASWTIVSQEIFHGHFWKIVLFYLIRFGLNLGAGIVAVFAMCATCCLAALPYINMVILLPVFVFIRCYTLHFVEQFGPQWKIFAQDGIYCPLCGYDLRGNPQATHCPECGCELKSTPQADPWQS